MRSIDEIRAEWKEALKEHEAAVQQYSPYIATASLAPGENPIPIPYEDLKVAHDRLEKTEEWLARIRQESYEAVRNKDR